MFCQKGDFFSEHNFKKMRYDFIFCKTDKKIQEKIRKMEKY